MTGWESLKAVLIRLRDERPNALTGYPDPQSDIDRRPPFPIHVAAWATDVAAELQDRYGPPPPAVRNLLDYASLKLLCMKVGVNAIERKRDSVTLKFQQNAAVDPEQLARFVAAQRGARVLEPPRRHAELLRVLLREAGLARPRHLRGTGAPSCRRGP